MDRLDLDNSKLDYWTSLWKVDPRDYGHMSGGETTRYRILQAFGEDIMCILPMNQHYI